MSASRPRPSVTVVTDLGLGKGPDSLEKLKKVLGEDHAFFTEVMVIPMTSAQREARKREVTEKLEARCVGKPAE